MYSYIAVDDEAIIREGLVKKINKLDMGLVCKGQAANGAEGLKLIESANPDIVITDMKMPEMDGMGFLDHLAAAYPDKKVIVLSSYRDFEYLNSAIENGVVGYVLKPFSAEEIRKQLNKAISLINRQQNMNAQVGYMKEHISAFEKRQSNRKLLDCIIHTAEAEISNSTESKEYSGVRKFKLITVKTNAPSLLPALERLCEGESHGIGTVPLEDESQKYCYFILLMDYHDHERILESFAQELALRILADNTGFVQYLCISDSCGAINEIHNLYRSCMDSFGKVRLSERQVKLKPVKQSMERIHSEDQIKAVFASLRYSPDELHESLNRFFDELEKSNVPFEVLHEECCSLIRLVNGYALQYDAATEDIPALFYDRYLFETTIDRIKRELSGYISLIFTTLKNSCQSQERLIEQIKNYLDTNYGSKITLEFIASNYFINPSYCSYLFKLKTGESFNDYLTRIRMAKAMNFLSESKMSIEEITKEVGYRNPKYFFRIFKQYNGLTPTEYRNGKKAK
jgi:YesN/AraC family two-component response regulator